MNWRWFIGKLRAHLQWNDRQWTAFMTTPHALNERIRMRLFTTALVRCGSQCGHYQSKGWSPLCLKTNKPILLAVTQAFPDWCPLEEISEPIAGISGVSEARRHES